MASKLCCTAEQQGREGSPDLPNARISAASPGSHFTSARSEDLLELRQIFDNGATTQSSPRAPRMRSSRPSIHSLQSLHRMTSLRSILKRKFSKDLSKKPSSASARKRVIQEDSETMVKYHRADPQRQFNIAKDDLRRNLLSNKKPTEGGYDSDAEVLNDVARNVGKKTPSKRPSIHSVDWSPSTDRSVTHIVMKGAALLTCKVNQLLIRVLARSAPSLSKTFSPTKSKSRVARHWIFRTA